MNLIDIEKIISESGKSHDFIKAAYHEAGHALAASLVGWGVECIHISPENSIYKTSYDFGKDTDFVKMLDKLEEIVCDDKIKDIVIRRSKVAMAGGICEEIYAEKYEIDYDDDTSDCDYNLIAHLNIYLKKHSTHDLKYHMTEVHDIIQEKWDVIEDIVVALINLDGRVDKKAFNGAIKKLGNNTLINQHN